MHQEIITEEGGCLWCAYRLLQEPDSESGGYVYGVECELEGMSDSQSPHNYAALHSLSAHKEKVQQLLELLAREQVLPVHIMDVVNDLMG